jgi:hypothetical protein
VLQRVARVVEGTIVDGGNTIIGKGELSKDGSTWEKDLDLTYRRVEHTERGICEHKEHI